MEFTETKIINDEAWTLLFGVSPFDINGYEHEFWTTKTE
jgi:hypothetical protein